MFDGSRSWLMTSVVSTVAAIVLIAHLAETGNAPSNENLYPVTTGLRVDQDMLRVPCPLATADAYIESAIVQPLDLPMAALFFDRSGTQAGRQAGDLTVGDVAAAQLGRHQHGQVRLCAQPA